MILHYKLPPEGTSPRSTHDAPTELVSVDRMIMHCKCSTRRRDAPTELVSVERMSLHYKFLANSHQLCSRVMLQRDDLAAAFVRAEVAR